MYQRKNFAYGKVATAPSPAASGTSLTLETGQGARFPNTSGGTYLCVIKQTNLPATPDIAEVVLVTTHDPANDTFTITRAQDSSSARTVVVGDEFYLSPVNAVWGQIDVLTTKGDLLTQSAAGVYARLAVGADNKILTALASETTGLKWADVGAVSIIRGETPSGTINSSNTSFTLANTPVTGTLRLYQNGIRLNAGAGNDYTISTATITMSTAPATGDTLLADYETNAGTYASGSASFVRETPTGTVNGSNTAFDTAYNYVAGTIMVFRDGQLMKGGGADYTETDANTITFVTAPVTGSVLEVYYQKSVSTAGNADLVDGYNASDTPTDGVLVPYYGGWVKAVGTWAYASASTITVPSGAATYYQKGDKIRLKQGAGYKYFYITTVADTLLTVTGGSDYTVANSAITDAYFSHQENPMGFPSRFAYTPTMTGDSVNPTLGSSTLVGKFTIQGGLCFLSVRYTVTTGGSFNAGSGIYRFSLPATCSVNGESHYGWGALVDYSTSLVTCIPEIWSSGTTVNLIRMFDGANVADSSLTWANNDKIWLHIIYPL